MKNSAFLVFVEIGQKCIFMIQMGKKGKMFVSFKAFQQQPINFRTLVDVIKFNIISYWRIEGVLVMIEINNYTG